MFAEPSTNSRRQLTVTRRSDGAVSPMNIYSSNPVVSSRPSSQFGVGSSRTLPLPAIPKNKGIERSPTLPPRPPFTKANDSFESHREHLKINPSKQHFKKAHDPHKQAHRHREFKGTTNGSGSSGEEKEFEDIEEAKEDEENVDSEYLTLEEVNFPKQEAQEVSNSKEQSGGATTSPTFSSDEDDGQASDDGRLDDVDEDTYLDFNEEKVVMVNAFTKMGGISKELSLHVRMQPESIEERTTLCLSMIWGALPNLQGDDGCTLLCPVVSCTSFPNNVVLQKPVTLEIQHCAVVKDVRQCKPRLWCMRHTPGKLTFYSLLKVHAQNNFKLLSNLEIIDMMFLPVHWVLQAINHKICM